ncbi:MAG: hypothetical protein EA391_13265 [Balneolaceae bacterium]|nr:MAG: hypothetical protein EA391_13265 [Balneolaceae bacterium]
MRWDQITGFASFFGSGNILINEVKTESSYPHWQGNCHASNLLKLSVLQFDFSSFELIQLEYDGKFSGFLIF